MTPGRLPSARRIARFSIVANDGSFFWRAIPKNASTTLRALLGSRGQTLLELCPGPLQEWPLPPTFPRWSFAAIRNPESRVISAWLNKLQSTELAPGQVTILEQNPGLRMGMPLAEFIAWLADDLQRGTPDPHWCPQHHYIYDKRGVLLVDYLARCERLAADLAAFSDRLGVLGDIPLINPTGSEAIELTLKDRSRIRAIYAADFELLGYD